MFDTLTQTGLKAMAQHIRKDVLIQTFVANSGHPGGPLSAADYLTTLFFRYLRSDPQRPDWPDRDRFVLSNGHCSALIYALLARREFFPLKTLLSFRQSGSILQGHPNRLKVPGLDASTGSLGQGLGLAHGMALAARRTGKKIRVFVNLGDGELQEGAVWEALMAAGHYKSENLIAMVDYNQVQIDGRVEDVMGVAPLAEKLRAFRWRVIEADGHDYDAIDDAFFQALSPTDRPSIILFKTRMMHGVASFEDDAAWHGRPPKEEELAQMLVELGFELTVEEAVRQYREGRA